MANKKVKSKKGWIYVISNPSMQGYVKIGRTGKHPYDRIRDMQTGAPLPYQMEFMAEVKDMYDAEKRLHICFRKDFDLDGYGEWYQYGCSTFETKDDLVGVIESEVNSILKWQGAV